ncbi:MAG: hypothetical protein PF569_05000 [Candidatus Woesearchaeota archaeon]|jgi:hypothetical protein|nr:hypothetical protein [Candidatus Woesearchaeota archaeon]
MKHLIKFLTIFLFFILCCNISFAGEYDYRYHFDNATACDCMLPDLTFKYGGSPTGLSVQCVYVVDPEKRHDGFRNSFSSSVDF